MEKEHVATRTTFIQEATRVENAINTNTDKLLLDLKGTTETDQRCRTFLQSLKFERMNQRYTRVMDPRDASFNQVFASYKERKDMYYPDPEDNVKPNKADRTKRDRDNVRDDENSALRAIYYSF